MAAAQATTIQVTEDVHLALHTLTHELATVVGRIDALEESLSKDNQEALSKDNPRLPATCAVAAGQEELSTLFGCCRNGTER